MTRWVRRERTPAEEHFALDGGVTYEVQESIQCRRRVAQLRASAVDDLDVFSGQGVGEIERPVARPSQFAEETVGRAGAGADGRNEDVCIEDGLKHEGR